MTKDNQNAPHNGSKGKEHSQRIGPGMTSGESWIEESIREHNQKGGFENLPGKGKALAPEYLKGDVLTSILKNANYAPPWVDQQHKIRDALLQVIEKKNQGNSSNLKEQIEIINQEIRKYNRMCPSSLLQKGLVNEDNLERQIEKWR